MYINQYHTCSFRVAIHNKTFIFAYKIYVIYFNNIYMNISQETSGVVKRKTEVSQFHLSVENVPACTAISTNAIHVVLRHLYCTFKRY